MWSTGERMEVQWESMTRILYTTSSFPAPFAATGLGAASTRSHLDQRWVAGLEPTIDARWWRHVQQEMCGGAYMSSR
jgi:hypothetical protein